MNNNFDSKHLWWVVWILGAILFVKIAWVAISWLIPLPVTGVTQEKNELKHSLHYRYRLASDKAIKAPVQQKIKKAAKPSATLSAYHLVGIYSTSDLALVTLMKGGKSFILSNRKKGGEVAGYHLKDANATAARFEKDDEITVLRLYEKKLPPSAILSHHPMSPMPAMPKGIKGKPERSLIVNDGDSRQIDRSLIKEYTQNPEKIWKNIGLHEVKSNGKLDGFKVRFVRKGSPFEKLGLERGDIIKAINGEPIVDYATPMRMLRSADTIDDLSLTIERNHEEQELKYEVK